MNINKYILPLKTVEECSELLFKLCFHGQCRHCANISNRLGSDLDTKHLVHKRSVGLLWVQYHYATHHVEGLHRILEDQEMLLFTFSVTPQTTMSRVSLSTVIVVIVQSRLGTTRPVIRRIGCNAVDRASRFVCRQPMTAFDIVRVRLWGRSLCIPKQLRPLKGC